MSFGRRVPPRKVRIQGRHWADVRQEVQELLDALVDAEDNGLPAGFGNRVPVAPAVGGTGSAGQASDGWMGATAVPPIRTGAPAGLANANVQGTSGLFADAASQPKRDVRVQKATVDVGTRNALNFSVRFAVTDVPGSDRVDVDLASGGLVWVPLTTVVAGVPDLVWDADNQLVMTQVTL